MISEPQSPEGRADLDVVIAAVERGFRIAVRCRECGHWLVAKESVRRQMGKRCHDRMSRQEAA